MATTRPGGVISHLRTAALLADGAGMTDGALLDCFITARDEAAFALLVRRHGPMVFGVCRRVLGHVQDAEDAFQAAFLVLARKAASVRPREAVGNWLYGVAYRTARRAKALAARRWAREKQVHNMPHPATQAQAEVVRELEPLLDEELSRLKDMYRLPVVLCDLEGKTRKDVARQLGIPEGTLSSRLATARRLLAGRLARRGFAPPVAALAAALSQMDASACLPPPLSASTVRAAVQLCAGQATTGLISAKVAALTEGVLKTMLLTKLKIVTGSVLLTAAVVLATSLGARHAILGPHAHAMHEGGRADGTAPSGTTGTQAAEADAQVKEAVEQFLKAMKATDVDGLLKVADVPFCQGAVIKTRAQLRADLQRALDRRDFSRDITEVKMVATLAEFEKALGKKLPEAHRKFLPEVLGTDHRMVLVEFSRDDAKQNDAKPRTAIAVRLQDGHAKVVGIIDGI